LVTRVTGRATVRFAGGAVFFAAIAFAAATGFAAAVVFFAAVGFAAVFFLVSFSAT
jgi:hypothetical protein